MAKRSKKKKAIRNGVSSSAPSLASSESLPKSFFRTRFSAIGVPLLLAAVAFFAYWPSLKSDFVYDARPEILEEGFITSISNVPAVLSLKVLGMNLMLGARPGTLLYLMLNAAIWGKEPWGYHLSSNLLHAANVALLFVLLRRLIATEATGMDRSNVLKVQLAAAVAALIFALHPIATESVAEVSYSSSLLVTFFTLLALLAATAFRPGDFRATMITGIIGTFCTFASVASKESGITAALLLIVYWFLFRRHEAKGPWLWFLGAATVATALFLAARFSFAPPSEGSLNYLGGSFSQVVLTQPRLWVFMMGQLLWPAHLSADYTQQNLGDLSTPFAIAVLVIVVGLQAWLAFKSQTGALGVAMYWLGLATVSNFIPLYLPMADRFYYLPLAGMATQLLASLLILLKSRRGFWIVLALLTGALLPLLLLTMTRETVFSDEFSLWSDTHRASPYSSHAEYGLAMHFHAQGKNELAFASLSKAIELNPTFAPPYLNRGDLKAEENDLPGAIADYSQAIRLDPRNVVAYCYRGYAYYTDGELQNALLDFRKSLAIAPGDSDDYPRFFIWLIEARMPNQMTMADKELGDYLHTRTRKEDDWSLQVGHFLIGELSQDDFLKAAYSTNEKKTKGRLCEAYFYIAMKLDLMGDSMGARSFLQQCIGTNQKDYTEYQVAQSLLKREK